MTNSLRCLPLAALFALTSCCTEAPPADPAAVTSAVSSTEAAKLPEVRYYVIADT
ncbi:MAG: hypothetical protein QF404_07470 [Planctomycetota bacterium]|jgi:hypothetical protein|nr:hypothetical protein [Planctomycetota bacterium]MDP6938061.1 hypothetical protein [Planctomycetota bacterium]